MLTASLTVSASYLTESQTVSSILVDQYTKDLKNAVYRPEILKNFIYLPEILKNFIYQPSRGLESDNEGDRPTETLNIVIYPPKAGGVKLETATSSKYYYEDVSLTFRTDTRIKLTAVEGRSPSPDYIFYRWSGDESPSEVGPSINIVMNGNKKITACFIQKTKNGPKNDKPFADFIFRPKNPKVGDEVTFDGSNSYDPDYGDIVDYRWSYSESNNEREIVMGSGKSITYSWNSPATYIVNLVVTDDERDSNRASKQIVVNGEEKTFKIEYKVEPRDGGKVILNPDQPEYKPDTVVKVTAIANANRGYKFNEWRGSITGNNESVEIIMDSNKEFIANFTDREPDKFKIKVIIEPSDECGTVVLDPEGPEYEPETVVNLTAITNIGYKFVEWKGDVEGNSNFVQIKMDDDKEVIANFTETQEEFRLIACADPRKGGEVELHPPGPLYKAGQVVNLTAIANSGYIFERWDGDIEDDRESVNITMDSDKDVLALFTEKSERYSLTVNIFPPQGGSVALTPSGGIYDPDTLVTLSADANSGYIFERWDGDIEGNSESIQITMDSNKTINASFTEELENKYSLTVNIFPSDGGTVILDPSGGEYDPGTIVNVTANAYPGYIFDRWEENDDSDTKESIEVEMDSDKTINAVFNEIGDLKVSIVSPRYNLLYIFNREITRFRKNIIPRIIGPVNVEVDIENASGEVLLKLYVDNELTISDTTLGHTTILTWNERAFRKHTIKISAMDETGRHAEDSIEVRVFNFGMRK